MKNYGMVIVGAGEAGARAAVELRMQGWTGTITLIGGEKRHPYERPPLSKQQLYDDDEPSPVVILNNEMLREYDIRFISGCSAVHIDRHDHSVALSDGSRIRYERLLLTTGATPRKLTVQGTALESVMYLRTFADALALRERLLPYKRVTVIGGGFIGLEVAASAIMKGCHVSLIEVGPRILMRGVPEEIARMVEARHRAAGVDFKLGVFIDSIDRTDRADDEYAISLADGTSIRCDAIVCGIGAIPETALAAECGLEIDNGVRVNEFLVTNDPDIYAAGDCCSFPHPLYSGKQIRLEAWRNAQDQGTHAAGNMLGASVPYAVVPWFWSDQYDQTLQVAGLSDSTNTTVLRDLGDAGKLFFHLAEDGRLVSVSGMGPSDSGIAKEIRMAEMLIGRQAKPEAAFLSDPTRRLKELLRG